MKQIALSFFAAIMLMGSGFGVYAYSKTADTPACCQNHEACCPSSSCCAGGKHAHCPMTHHHA